MGGSRLIVEDLRTMQRWTGTRAAQEPTCHIVGMQSRAQHTDGRLACATDDERVASTIWSSQLIFLVEWRQRVPGSRDRHGRGETC